MRRDWPVERKARHSRRKSNLCKGQVVDRKSLGQDRAEGNVKVHQRRRLARWRAATAG